MVPREAGFRDDLYRARDLRADIAFGEQLIEIADNTADDWSFNKDSGKLSVNKEALLRSKIRIKARQFHMSRLHRDTWGDKVQADIKHDYSNLTEEERLKKAYELASSAKSSAAQNCRRPSNTAQKRLKRTSQSQRCGAAASAVDHTGSEAHRGGLDPRGSLRRPPR